MTHTQARVKDDGINWRLGEECADDKILKCHPRDRISKTTFFRTEKVRGQIDARNATHKKLLISNDIAYPMADFFPPDNR